MAALCLILLRLQADEAYDSKTFAVTTLLSTALVYNTMKIIDHQVRASMVRHQLLSAKQQTIENLELLAWRANMFNVKAGMANGKMSPFQFPHLIWVVQDFALDFPEGVDTPTEWLHQVEDSTHVLPSHMS